METRVAIIGIIVENEDSVEELNSILHTYGSYRGVNIIAVAVDAPQEIISALSGKLGRLDGVSAKAAYSNVITKA